MRHPHLYELRLKECCRREAERQVRELAYYKWLAAGRPIGKEDQFWDEAELEWIEYFYVPDRGLEFCEERELADLEAEFR